MSDTIEPIPVIVAGPSPVPVVIAAGTVPPRSYVQAQETDPSIPARTTFQEDLTTAGQRRINLIWEYTQSLVTITVVATNMLVAALNAIRGTAAADHPVILSTSLFLILGFYYSRTNHAAIGGVGIKATGPYIGR